MNDAPAQTTTTPEAIPPTTSPSSTTAPVSTPILANSTEARTPDGTIKDQTPTQPVTTPEAKPNVEPGTTNPTTDPTKSAEPTTTTPTEYKFTTPEGITLDPALIASATPIFRELGLDQAAAQKLVDFQIQATKAASDANIKAVSTMRETWRNEIATDSEMGGKTDAIKADMGRAKDAVLGPKGSATRDKFDLAMDLTGAGDNPDIVRGWWKIAQQLNGGSHVSGGNPSPHGQVPNGAAKRPSAAAALYPSLAN